MSSASGEASGGGIGPGHALVFGVLWLLVLAAAVLFVYPHALTGGQLDADGYMRLVRIGLLVETGAWFDHVIPRSNWPWGEPLHWTRPLDVLILALAAPLIPFIGTGPAINASGSLVSPLLLLASCLAMVWVAAPLVSQRALALVAPALLVQPVVLSYGLPGRADHHALIGLLFILAVGTAIRWRLEPSSTRWPALAGALAALGIWVSPEFLLPLALLYLLGGLLWLSGGRQAVPPNLALAGTLLAGLALALLFERPPEAWLREVHDRISIVHLAMGAVALGFWGAMAMLTGRWQAPAEGSAGARAIAGALGALLTAGVLGLLYPDFFRGPWISADPEVQRIWLSRVQELQPLYPSIAGAGETGGAPWFEGLGRAFSVAGMAPLAIVLLGLLPRAREEWGEAAPGPGALLSLRVVLGGGALLFALMTLAQLRWGIYLGVFVALGVTMAVDLVLARIDRSGLAGMRPRLLRVGAIVVLLPGALLAGFAAETGFEAVLGEPREPAGAAVGVEGPAGEAGGCPIASVAPFLRDPSGLGARPVTVLAHMDRGPEILFRTPHRILAGPYHRNAPGILDGWRAFTSPDLDEVRGILARREVELIVLCPEEDAGFLGSGPATSLFHRLVEGGLPTWVEPLALPDEVDARVRVFRVQGDEG